MSHHEIRRKILKQLNDEVSNSPNQPRKIRRVHSSNALGGTDNLSEETKGDAGGLASFAKKEAPPKDNNERVERLLTKLDNASRMTDME